MIALIALAYYKSWLTTKGTQDYSANSPATVLVVIDSRRCEKLPLSTHSLTCSAMLARRNLILAINIAPPSYNLYTLVSPHSVLALKWAVSRDRLNILFPL